MAGACAMSSSHVGSRHSRRSQEQHCSKAALSTLCPRRKEGCVAEFVAQLEYCVFIILP